VSGLPTSPRRSFSPRSTRLTVTGREAARRRRGFTGSPALSSATTAVGAVASAREARFRGSALLDEEDAARMDARIDAAAQSRRLYAAMDRLSEGERAVMELVAIDELTVAEAAAAAGVRPVTARVRLHRARRKLRAELEAASTESTANEVDET
jgi:RNA polymerase sigma factor (sigma-70 family)